MLYTLGTCTFPMHLLRAVNRGEQGTHMVWVHIYMLNFSAAIPVQVYIEKYHQFLSDWELFNNTGKVHTTTSEVVLPAPDVSGAHSTPDSWATDQRGQKWDARMEMGLKSDWLASMAIPDLAIKYQRTEDAVKRRLRRLGISTKDDPRVVQAKSFLRK